MFALLQKHEYSTYRVTTGGAAVFDDLQLSGATGSVILQFTLAGSAVVVDSSAINISATGGKVSGKSGSSGNSGCSAAAGQGWLALLGLLALTLVAARLRRIRA